MKYIIWDNDITDDLLKSEKEMYLEDNPDSEIGDSLLYDLAYETIQMNLDDDVSNLDINMPGEIFLLGTLSRWDGKHSAYKGLKTKNIGEALEKAVASFDGDNRYEISVDEGKMLIKQWGHDNPVNPSVFEFRSVNKNYMDIENLIYSENEDSSDFLIKHSTSPVEKVCKVYGWEMAA